MTDPRRGAGQILLFAAACAALLTALRLFILARHGQLPLTAYLPGAVLAAAAEFMLGFVFAYLVLVRCRSRPCAWLLWALFTAVLFVKIGALHYEAVFNRMPALQLLFYIGELKTLSASLQANFPPAQVAAELVLVTGLLVLLARRLDASAAPVTPAQAALPCMLLLVAIVINAADALLPPGWRSASREPLIALLQSAFVRQAYDLDQLRLGEEDFTRFLALHGRPDAGPVLDPRFPLCRPRADTPPPVHPGRSLIVVILESVGRQELDEAFRGEPLLPNLRRLSTEHLYFTRAHAPGIKSIQTLTALFSALPPNPINYYLWQKPLPDFDGWPRQLAQRGYRTAYLHGGDLSFERQRAYLEAVGFDTVIEMDATRDTPTHGWGYDDGTMFRELRAWVDARQDDDVPYLATLFTLGTHDPYLVPPDWTPVFSPVARQLRDPGKCCAVIGEPDTSAALAETYRFLDAQIGAFDAWYRTLEPRPLLLILGDHAPYVVQQGSVARDPRLRFDIPVLLAGLDDEERQQLEAVRDEPLSVHDLPILLSQLLGLPAHPCFAGADPRAGGERGVAYAVAPESLQFLHLWRGNTEYVLDRASNHVTALDTDGRELPGADTRWVLDFAAATFPVHYYLLHRNAYFPRAAAAVRPLATVTRPLFAAHRGNVDGPGTSTTENSRAALARAAAAEFEWVEIDLQLTADAVPVLAHDPVLPGAPDQPIVTLTLEQLRALPGGAGLLTLEEALREILPHGKLLIELKPQARLQDRQQLVRETAALLARFDAGSRVIVDSFDEYLAASMKRQCRCEVGLDTVYRQRLADADLAHVRSLGLDWIYVEHSVVDADLVRRAHRAGLKVMAYTVNDRAVIDAWRRAGALPDGIITDHADVAAGW